MPKKHGKKVLYHFSELFRMGATNHRGARYRVVFLLIALNRDDDAFAFSQYWLQMDERCDTDPETVYSTHDYSYEGGWVYPFETDCRYSDPLPYCANVNPNVILLPLVVSFLTIKLKIVAIHDAAVRSAELALTGKAGQRIQQVEPLNIEILFRQNIDFECQQEHIRQFLDVIDHLNPSVLPSLINPSPLMKQPPPPRSALGDATEAWRILIDCSIAIITYQAQLRCSENDMVARKSTIGICREYRGTLWAL